MPTPIIFPIGLIFHVHNLWGILSAQNAFFRNTYEVEKWLLRAFTAIAPSSAFCVCWGYFVSNFKSIANVKGFQNSIEILVSNTYASPSVGSSEFPSTCNACNHMFCWFGNNKFKSSNRGCHPNIHFHLLFLTQHLFGMVSSW